MSFQRRATVLGDNVGLRSEVGASKSYLNQTEDPGRYQLTSYFNDCDLEKQLSMSLAEPGNVIRNGYGNALGCNIDSDSKLRNEATLTNPRLKHPLHERLFLSVPYMGREDVFAVDDLGIQQAMIRLYKIDNTDKKALKEKMLQLSAKWSPYRTYACLHLWQWKDEK